MVYIRWLSGSSKQSRFDETRLTLRIHRGKTRRSNSVPRISPPLTGNLKPSKSIGTTSLDRRRECLAKSRTEQLRTECVSTVNEITKTESTNETKNFSPILHMMSITLNRKENIESFLCNNTTANETINQIDSNMKIVDGNNKTIKGVGKRIFKAHAKRYLIETKAAKTLAIIVGFFIMCWLPFFTMYLVRAFCELCIEPLLFSILFWLGYCNSAINPLIYALFSKEFRIAFKTILYKCLCVHCFGKNRRNDGGIIGTNNEYTQKMLNSSGDGSRWRHPINTLRGCRKNTLNNRNQRQTTAT